MAFFKCKMCGGGLEVQDGMTVCECEYCGSKQTIPSNADGNVQALYNRANVLRMKAEFDKASDLYEKILQMSPTESEAYWGLILCKYGVEYVEESETMRRVPTCHRTSYDAITADEDYKNAVYYASTEQKILFEKEAKTIDEIQKGILEISQNEDTYDVFICYKEKDENGMRTQDSVIANDIYYQLTQQNFKVFYAAITLEDKLGSEYEPYIFSALNSAKVMLVLGTKAEYFNAVWVKNEWSRFLHLMKKDRSKILIPCFRDVDVYELPEEFAHLQAQDMSKIGFINDIVRGINKVVIRDEPKAAEKESVANDYVATRVDPLLMRTEMFLEDKNWNRAHELCEQVLNTDPENAQAYLYELMGDLKVSTKAELPDCPQPFEKNQNYKKILRFASDELKSELQEYNSCIVERNETDRKNRIYSEAMGKMAESTTESSYNEAAELFRSISGWKDADDKMEEAQQKAEVARKDSIYQSAIKLSSENTSEAIEKAINKLGSIYGWKDAGSLQEEYRIKLEDVKKREILLKEYAEKYNPIVTCKKENEERLKTVQDELSKLEKNKMYGSNALIIFGVVQLPFYLQFAYSGIATTFVVAVIVVCIMSICGGIKLKLDMRTKKTMLQQEETEISNKIYELHNSILSFEEFCKLHSDG